MTTKRRIHPVWIPLSALAVVSLAIAGCNAVQGLGQDLSETSEATEKAIFDNDESGDGDGG